MVLYYILTGAENDDLTKQFISLRGITVIDLLILLVVIIILVILILQLLCRNCCERRSDNGELSFCYFFYRRFLEVMVHQYQQLPLMWDRVRVSVRVMVGFKLTTLVVISTDCKSSCKSKYHTIMTTVRVGILLPCIQHLPHHFNKRGSLGP
jgi:hypothetical protein